MKVLFISLGCDKNLVDSEVMLKLLEKKGYLYRECAKEDARLKKIIPTEKAVCLRGQLLKSIERTEERIRQGIPEEDLKVFFRVLKQISANLSSWEEENKMGKEEIER